MVWDTIYARDAGRDEPTQEWGGIAYALSAFEAAAGDDWTLFPMIKLGRDLEEPAFRFLNGLEKLDSLEGVQVVSERNNRVELRYDRSVRTCERLTGGVPGWSAAELLPLASACDALYVNFIAGWELDLAAARGLGSELEGPIYCDIHSLLLGVGPGGFRRLRCLEEWREWLACFDIVQVNEAELTTLASGEGGDPWRVVAQALSGRTRAVLVTLGSRGAAWIASPSFWRRGLAARRGSVEDPALASGLVESERIVPEADPTGCGDVWGITCFTSMLAGDSLETAMGRANELASRNAELRGASHLARVLRRDGRLLPGEAG